MVLYPARMAILEPVPEESQPETAAPPAEACVRLGWALFFEFSEGLSARAAYLLGLVDRLRAFSAPYRFTRVKYGGTADARYDEVTKQRLAGLQDRVRRSAFDLAPGKMLSLKNRYDPEPFGQVHLEVLFRTSPERLHALYYYAPREAFAREGRLRELFDIADEAWAALGGVHAYVNPVLGLELYHGGEGIPRACDLLEANRILEVNDNWNFLPLFRDKVKGPAFSLSLGPRPAAALGGLDRIAREAPVSLVRTLPGGGCALELLEAPAWEEDADAVEAYARLARYLKPVAASGVAPLVLGKSLEKRGIDRGTRFAGAPDEEPGAPRPKVRPVARPARRRPRVFRRR